MSGLHYPETRYLLVGAAGLIGSHLRRALSERHVTVTHHRVPTKGSVYLDITDRGAVEALVQEERPDVVVLAAAEPHVERCEREPEATRRVNVEGTRHIATATAEVGATLVVFSSEYVFDGAREAYTEEDSVGPLNEYGRQKVEVERIAAGTVQHLTCRTSGVFGAEDQRKNFVLQVVDALRSGKTFVVPLDQIITPSDAVTLAGSVVELLDHSARGVFHVAGPERLPRADFAQRVARAFELDAELLRAVPTAKLGLAAPRPLRAGLRDDKLRAALGHGLTPVDEALRDLARKAGQ